MRITALIENSCSRENLTAEHGLSLLIEANGRCVLFDAGQSGAAIANADALGIDLSRVDTAILSHGHYDHAGGFEAFFERNPNAPLYVHTGFDLPHWHGEKYIGVSAGLASSGRVRTVDGGCDLGDGFRIVSFPDLVPLFPIDDDGLTEDGRPERFTHEQYLLVREGDACLLVSGCSHRDIANIMRWCGSEGVTHVIGGFHLMRTQPESPRVEELARELLAWPARYFTCHCTGEAQYGRLGALMEERLSYLATGDVLEL